MEVHRLVKMAHTKTSSKDVFREGAFRCAVLLKSGVVHVLSRDNQQPIRSQKCYFQFVKASGIVPQSLVSLNFVSVIRLSQVP
jgi:hypothetical protein